VTRIALAMLASAAAAQVPGTIATVAGTGVAGQTGDGGPATAAQIVHPRGIAIAPGGGFAFADAFGHTVRRVLADGTITTVAGTGAAGFSGDGGPATQAELDQPHGVAYTGGGILLVADALNNRVRAISPGGTISTVAGTGVHGFSGDGGPAAEAMLGAPRGVTAVPSGGYLIPDTDNDRVRLVRRDGVIVTVAGNGKRGFSGDGAPATAAQLDRPFAAVPLADGGLLIADTGNDRVRKVSADGAIATVAGNGVRGFGGDRGPATNASLNSPHDLALLPDGGFLIADEGNNRVRRVWPGGTITTVAGTGTGGFSGDGDPATAARLNQPKAVAVLPNLQGFLVADAANSRIRVVAVDLRPVLRLRLASRSLRIRSGAQAALVFELSAPATLRIDVREGTRTVARVSAKAARGRHTLRFGRSLRPGRYALAVRATASLAKPAQATASLVVTPGRRQG